MRYRRIRWLLALLLATIVCHAQTSIDLTENTDGTWTLNAMPAYDVMMEVEYEDDLSQAIDLTDNGDGTWTLDQMPDYNVKLVVEYEDVTPPSVTIAPVAKTGLLYTDEAQQLITAGDAEGGVMVYSLDGINFSETIPTATEVGLYTVYYKAKSNVPNCGDSYVQTLSVWIVANKTELNAIIEEAEAFYETIKNVPVTAATLLNTINAAKSVQEDMNATQTEVDNAKETLSVALLSIQDKAINLTDNGDGTWTLTAMPAWNVHIIVEYEDDLSQAIDLTDNGDGTWTLDQMPDYNVKLVVEYMDEATDISLADNASNAETLNAYNGETVNVTLDGRTLYKDGKWNTLTLPFDVSSLTGTPLEGATIMEMNTAKKNGFDTTSGTLYLAFKTATQIESGKPYLVKWTSGADIVEPVFSDVTISSTTPTAIESATSGLETVRMVGNYAPVTVKADDQSIMFMGDDNSLYYSSEDRTLRNFRAHFEIPSQQSAPALAHRFVIDFDGDEVVTGIDGIRIVNSDYTDGWYSLDGRRLDSKPLAKGVYIHNGNKVIVK